MAAVAATSASVVMVDDEEESREEEDDEDFGLINSFIGSYTSVGLLRSCTSGEI